MDRLLIQISLIITCFFFNTAQASISRNAKLLKEWKKSDNLLYRISIKETALTNQKLKLELALNETTENINTLSKVVENKRDYILYRIRYINQESGTDFLKSIIESSNPGELDRNMRFYLAMIQSDLDLIHLYSKDINKLESEKRKFLNRIEKLNKLKISIQKQLSVHIRELKKKNELLDKIKSNIKLDSNHWKKELRLALKNKNKDKIQLYQSLLNKSLLDRKGQLTSPTIYSVKYGFGVIKFNPSSPPLPFHGILYDTPNGSAVKAIADGSIVWIGKINGLGNTVILDHGRDIHSLYSRVSLANLHIGDTIEEGVTFSRVDDVSYFMGEGLYFELREKGQPTNPLRWLFSKNDFLLKDSNNMESTMEIVQ